MDKMRNVFSKLVTDRFCATELSKIKTSERNLSNIPEADSFNLNLLFSIFEERGEGVLESPFDNLRHKGPI